MMNKWEARERQTKRIALIAAVVLHLVIIVGLIYSTGKGSDQELIEHAEHVEADTKV